MSSKDSPFEIYPLTIFNKEISLPSSKSHSNRALIMGAIKGAGFQVENLSPSSDVEHLLSSMKKIGIRFKKKGSTVVFENSFPDCENENENEEVELETGDGGTTNRFLMALLAKGKKKYFLNPSERMRERPIMDLIIPLKKIGVEITHFVEHKKNWLTIQGPAQIQIGESFVIDCEKSTQFASALLLAFSDNSLSFHYENLNSSKTYLKMTEYVIKECKNKKSFSVPVDFSSLSYPVALAALSGSVLIKNCHSLDSFQSDSLILEILKESGASVLFLAKGLEVRSSKNLKPFHFDVSKSPDLFPILIFLSAHIDGVSTFFNLNILQYKESDRLNEMLKILNEFSVKTEFDLEKKELKVFGKSNNKYKKITMRPARDHRIVMALAFFMAYNSGGVLYEVDCIKKSYPDFIQLLK